METENENEATSARVFTGGCFTAVRRFFVYIAEVSRKDEKTGILDNGRLNDKIEICHPYHAKYPLVCWY